MVNNDFHKAESHYCGSQIYRQMDKDNDEKVDNLMQGQ